MIRLPFGMLVPFQVSCWTSGVYIQQISNLVNWSRLSFLLLLAFSSLVICLATASSPCWASFAACPLVWPRNFFPEDIGRESAATHTSKKNAKMYREQRESASKAWTYAYYIVFNTILLYYHIYIYCYITIYIYIAILPYIYINARPYCHMVIYIQTIHLTILNHSILDILNRNFFPGPGCLFLVRCCGRLFQLPLHLDVFALGLVTLVNAVGKRVRVRRLMATRNPAITTSWGWLTIPLFTVFHTSQVVQDFFHQQYVSKMSLHG